MAWYHFRKHLNTCIWTFDTLHPTLLLCMYDFFFGWLNFLGREQIIAEEDTPRRAQEVSNITVTDCGARSVCDNKLVERSFCFKFLSD